MSRKSLELRRSFVAVDASGEEHLIYVFQWMIDDRSLDGAERIGGLKELRAADGSPVNREEKGVYTVITGFRDIRLTSDDPDAE